MELKEYEVIIKFFVEASSAGVAQAIGDKISAYIYSTDSIDSEIVGVKQNA